MRGVACYQPFFAQIGTREGSCASASQVSVSEISTRPFIDYFLSLPVISDHYMGNRIVLLLSILMLSFFATAMMIRSLMTENDILTFDAETISANIHQKEDVIESLYQDSILMRTYKNVERYPSQVLDIARKLYDDHFFFTIIYKQGTPIFWSSSLIEPPSIQDFHQETSFANEEPRSYVAKRKDVDEETTILTLIPIKRNFAFSNEYLTNKFYDGIIKTNNLDIAHYTDTKTIRNIYSKGGEFLFSVKFKEGKYHNIFISLQLLFWVLGTITFLALFNYWSYRLAKQGHAWPSVALMASVIAVLRLVSLKANWITDISSLGLFDPKHYAYNPFLPNLWEFIMTSFVIAWFIFYVLSIQKFLINQNKIKKRESAIALSAIALSSVYVVGYFLTSHMSTLITHTPNVNMDFLNILGFNAYSWINIAMICLNMVIFLFYIDLIVVQVRTMLSNLTIEINLQLIILIFFLFISVIFLEESLPYSIIIGVAILIRAYSGHKYSQYHFVSLILTLLSISLLSSITYTRGMRLEEIKEMALTLNYLEAENDLNAMSVFPDIESSLNKDTVFANLLLDDVPDKEHVLSNYIKLNYIDGYLSKYEQQFYYYFNGSPLTPYPNDKIVEYREKVINNSVRVPQTEHFYRVRSELGTHEYFLQMEIPLDEDEEDIVQIFINLKNRSYSPSLPYPEVLSENRIDLIREHYSSDAAFALYKDRSLFTQNGTYVYPPNDTHLPQEQNRHIRLPDSESFFHMMIRPDIHTTMVISKPLLNMEQALAIISFLFISLLVVYLLAKTFQTAILTVSSRSFSMRMLQYQLIMLRNRIRYSTRIQTMVLVVVISVIVISGTIVFFTVRKQLDKNNMDNLENQITEIAKKVENVLTLQDISQYNTFDRIQDINEFSHLDINVFDHNGQLIYTSQPRIYEIGLLSTYMNPYAYNELNVIKKTGISTVERIGDFEYSSSYSVIRNADYNTMAFINIPTYASKRTEIRSSNQLLNSLLNIYTIIILVAGFSTVFISRQVTRPLAIIGRKLAEINVSEKGNEPIYWERDDEIGSLVKEYNLMLVKMEESTKQLMNAEREYAWREMARQIAHEIKNPLTPMKLGVQQLMRSFQEDDPRFEERFKRFSNSFIDQINSLSKIAVEFSNFAKLPNTVMDKIDILSKITKVVNLFTSSPNTRISIINNTGESSLFVLGDRDQLLRTFNNLIKNAIEAARGRKRMLIDITLDYEGADRIRVSIQDNGLGIPPEVIPKIFQPNFTTKSSGTGLGLAFVKKTIESMHGDITFVTYENVGTTFTIILPIYREHIPNVGNSSPS